MAADGGGGSGTRRLVSGVGHGGAGVGVEVRRTDSGRFAGCARRRARELDSMSASDLVRLARGEAAAGESC